LGWGELGWDGQVAKYLVLGHWMKSQIGSVLRVACTFEMKSTRGIITVPGLLISLLKEYWVELEMTRKICQVGVTENSLLYLNQTT